MMTDGCAAGRAGSHWKVRENAEVYGPTRVGCAALVDNGQVFSGCNTEHRFRSHDIHAEVNAISTLVANDGTLLSAVLIAAERDRFTPYGSCLDWILRLAEAGSEERFNGVAGGRRAEEASLLTSVVPGRGSRA
jgi:cytidine deaminase